MTPRTALAVALVAGGAAVGIVAADTVWGLHFTVQGQLDGGWETLWRDPASEYEERFVERPLYGPYETCYGPTFRLLADNEKPLPDRTHVRVVYFDNETQRERALIDETLALGPFETKTLEWTVPPEAGAPANPYRPKEQPFPPPQIRVVFDGGWPDGHDLTFCVDTAGEAR